MPGIFNGGITTEILSGGSVKTPLFSNTVNFYVADDDTIRIKKSTGNEVIFNSGTSITSYVDGVSGNLAQSIADSNTSLSSAIQTTSGNLAQSIADTNTNLSASILASSGSNTTFTSQVSATLAAEIAAVGGTSTAYVDSVSANLAQSIADTNTNLSTAILAASGANTTFTSGVSASLTQTVSSLSSVVDTKANDSQVVHITGSETILGQKTFTSDVVINGNLFVNGTQTVVNTTEISAKDNQIVINSGETGPGVTAGYAGIRVDRGTAPYYDFQFRESDDAFVIGLSGQYQAVATREDTPINSGLASWNDSAKRFDTVTADSITGAAAAQIAQNYTSLSASIVSASGSNTAFTSSVSAALAAQIAAVGGGSSAYVDSVSANLAQSIADTNTNLSAAILAASGSNTTFTAQSIAAVNAEINGLTANTSASLLSINGVSSPTTRNIDISGLGGITIGSVGTTITISAAPVDLSDIYSQISTLAASATNHEERIEVIEGQLENIGLMYNGTVSVSANKFVYTVTHPSISGASFPVVSLMVPSITSTLYIQGIYNVAPSGFNVVLSGLPDEDGYAINWQRNSPNALIITKTFGSNAYQNYTVQYGSFNPPSSGNNGDLVYVV